MAEHEARVQLRTLRIILRRLSELAHDEQHLSPMIIDIRVVRILLDGFLEAGEGLVGIALLHMHGSDLDEGLCKGGDEVDGCREVGFGAVDVADEEVEGSSEVQGFGFALFPRDALIERLFDELEGLGVILRIVGGQGFEQELVAWCGCFRQSGMCAWTEGGEVSRAEGEGRQSLVAFLSRMRLFGEEEHRNVGNIPRGSQKPFW